LRSFVEQVVVDGDSEQADGWLVPAVDEGEGAGDYAFYAQAYTGKRQVC
jgi:hypothetical protein